MVDAKGAQMQEQVLKNEELNGLVRFVLDKYGAVAVLERMEKMGHGAAIRNFCVYDEETPDYEGNRHPWEDLD